MGRVGKGVSGGEEGECVREEGCVEGRRKSVGG